MKLPHRISKKELAEKAGVSAAAITRQFPEDHPAVLLRKVELGHPEVRAYLEKKAAKLDKFLAIPKNENGPKPAKTKTVDLPAEVPKQEFPEELYALTLQEIVDRYGHVSSFKVHVSALKELEAYRARQQKNERDRGELVEKATEGNLIFEVLESLFKRLAEDIPLTVTKRVIAIVKKGDDDAEMVAQRVYQEANSRALKISQNEIMDRLDDYRGALLGA